MFHIKGRCQCLIQSSQGSWWPWWRQRDIPSGNQPMNRMTQYRPQCSDRHPPGTRVGHHCHPVTWRDSILKSNSCYLKSDLPSLRILKFGVILYETLLTNSRKEVTENYVCHCVDMLQAVPYGTGVLCEVETEYCWDDALTLHVLWPLGVSVQTLVDVMIFPYVLAHTELEITVRSTKLSVLLTVLEPGKCNNHSCYSSVIRNLNYIKFWTILHLSE